MPVEIVAIPVVSKYAEPGKPFRATVQRLDTVKVTAKLIDEYRNVVNLTGCTVLIAATDKAKTTIYNATINDAANGLIGFVVQPDVVGRYALTAKVTSGNNDETTFFLGAVTVAVEDKDVGSVDTLVSLTQTIEKDIIEIENSTTRAQASAKAAAASADAAASSSTSAAASALNAATAATTKAAEASTSANNAATSASAANVSATNAETSETNAANSATMAATSAQNAATSETNAKASETSASTSATTATSKATEAVSSAASASNSASAANASATMAATSAQNAATSETNAKASETAAKTSETNAKNSETAAKTSENAAKTSEANAKTSENNAKTSETAANTSAGAAKTSETNAKTSETNAQNSATAAAESAASAAAAFTNYEEISGFTRTGDNTFTMSGDVSAQFPTGKLLRWNDSDTYLCRVYGTPTVANSVTTVTVWMQDQTQVIPASPTKLECSRLSPVATANKGSMSGTATAAVIAVLQASYCCGDYWTKG
jgi:phage repressor protein C with HTH and peptisase S24 domain